MHTQALAAVLLASVAGCSEDPTGIRLHVETDLRVPDELASIHIRIEPSTGDDDGLGLDRTVVPGTDAQLPIVIGIVPKDGDASRRVHVVVDPTPGPALRHPLVSFDRVLRFESGAVLDVYARFPGSCALRGGAACEEPCDDDDDCHDGIACTLDRCEPSGCVHSPDDSACPGGECDPAEGCGACDPDSCTGSPCTRAECIGGECVIAPLCTDDTSCCAGACVPLGCDDGDPCTRDSCDDATGCVHQDLTEDESGRRIDGCPSA